MDGPDRWFEFVKVISREKYQRGEAFEISLINHNIFGNALSLGKEGDHYLYFANLQLRPINDDIKDELEELWLYQVKLRENWQTERLKWKSIKATVTHDPENPGKAYLVHDLQFVE